MSKMFSPQVFRAELRLQELEEELLSCRVLQGLLQRETPLLYPLLTGLLTGSNGKQWREAVKTPTFCREAVTEEIRGGLITESCWGGPTRE